MQTKSIQKIIRDLKHLDTEYRPVSFWFLNHYLDPHEIRRQVRAIAGTSLVLLVFSAVKGYIL